MKPSKNAAPKAAMPQFSRRNFGTALIAGTSLVRSASASTGGDPDAVVLLPPPGAKVQSTACAYCVVGCGYKAYTWPVKGSDGGVDAADNALGVDYPIRGNGGTWVSPEMHNVVEIDGVPHHIVIVPDAETTVVNPGGDYNLGGSLARKLFSPGKPSDRLVRPQLRVEGKLVEIDWDAALRILAQVARKVVDDAGPTALGMKTYSYQGYENTFAITKFAFTAVGTPAWAPHDSPSETTSTPGLSDAGVNPFSAAYVDWANSEVLFVSGVSLYDAHSVLFNQWIMRGPRLIVVNPRRDETAEYALENDGIFLQIRPGTDTLLHNSLAWVILSEGWEDAEFIRSSCVTNEEEFTAAVGTNGRRAKNGFTFAEYRDYILSVPEHDPDVAAPVLGVSADDIRAAAEALAKPTSNGRRPKSSMMLEKGNMWTHNYGATSSFVSLGLAVGAGNREGQVISRAGGHQRGMLQAAAYPSAVSPDEVNGNKVSLNVDRWAMEGKLDLVWVIGCTWAGGGTAAGASLFERLKEQTRGTELPEVTDSVAFPDGRKRGVDADAVIQALNAKIAAGGLVLVQQDLYPQALTELADLVLPAAGWGEAPFSRMQGERRLRHYPKLADPPGEAKPDWWIVAQVAKQMGYEGFDWGDANAIFEEAGVVSKGSAQDYLGLVELAQERGQTATDLLIELGTTGIQSPIVREGDELRGTVRLHGGGFATPNGRALFVRGDWAEVATWTRDLAPPDGQLWVINRRTAGTWSSAVEDARIPYRAQLLHENPVELNPKDAESRGIVEGAQVVVQGHLLLAAGLEGKVNSEGTFRGVARISDAVPEGVCSTYFNFRGSPETAANNVVSNRTEPVSGQYAFKLGRGQVSLA